MTEEQNDQPAEGPMSESSPETAPSGVPETTGQAAIPLPAVAPAAARAAAARAVRHPSGRRGARSHPDRRLHPAPGHLCHGRPGRQPDARRRSRIVLRRSADRPRRPHLVDAPTRRGPRCRQPPGPERPPRRRSGNRGPRRRLRHRPCHVEQREQHPGLQPDVGQLVGAFRSRFIRQLRLIGEPLRQRFALRRCLRRLGQFRQHREFRLRSSGSSNSSGPSDVNAIASKVDPGLVDINTTLGYQQEQAAGTGIVLSQRHHPDQQPRHRRGHQHQCHRHRQRKTYKASVVGYDRTKDIAVLQLKNASGLQTADARQLLERLRGRGRRGHRQRRRHRRHPERGRRHGDGAEPVDHRQ